MSCDLLNSVISTIVAVLPNMRVAYMFTPPYTEHTIREAENPFVWCWSLHRSHDS